MDSYRSTGLWSEWVQGRRCVTEQFKYTLFVYFSFLKESFLKNVCFVFRRHRFFVCFNSVCLNCQIYMCWTGRKHPPVRCGHTVILFLSFLFLIRILGLHAHITSLLFKPQGPGFDLQLAIWDLTSLTIELGTSSLLLFNIALDINQCIRWERNQMYTFWEKGETISVYIWCTTEKS